MGPDIGVETTRHPPNPSAFTTDLQGKSYDVVREGLAEILSPRGIEESKSAPNQNVPKTQTVFYNPIQQFNRDLTVLAIRTFGNNLGAIREARQGAGPGIRRGKKRKRENEEERSSHGNQPNLAVGDGIPKTVGGENNSNLADGTNSNAENDGRAVGTDGAGENHIGQSNGRTALAPAGEFRIFDALSATGLRAIRYAKEVPMATSVVANDLSLQAVNSIKLNIDHNQLCGKVSVTNGDARAHMEHAASPLNRGKQSLYEVIDLDPYGTAAPFLDAAVRAVVDGGLLCITCTDAGVFASLGYLEKTYSQYGGLPFKGPQSHEAGLRLILHAIATSAARYSLSIEPLLSLSIDFYARVFVRVRRSAAEVKFLASKTMIVFNCDEGCGAWSTQFLSQSRAKKDRNDDTIYKFSLAKAPSADRYCAHCGFKTHLSGPMWGGPIHNPHFIQRMLALLPSLSRETYVTIPRIEGMLDLALHESASLQTKDPSTESVAGDLTESISVSDKIQPFPPVDPSIRDSHPFFITPSSLAKVLHCVSPSDAVVRGALAHLGYRSSRSHTKPGTICTDAPWAVIWEVMREWVRQKAPIKEDAIKKGTPGWGIMRNDRSKKGVNGAKRQVIERLDKCEDLSDLKPELEAALWRVEHAMGGEERNSNEDNQEGEEKVDDSLAIEEDRLTSDPEPQPATEEILTHELKIVFDEAFGKEPRGKKMLRYQMNPRADWGPMNRAKGL
ncbi:RNA methyltransferase tRNA(m5U54)methyltransferase [Pseudocyphellaria aurata]|nr:RNA methyltransferase tRNA(m5U54)methyltransferase [Pseudocyphellaria aurata]